MANTNYLRFQIGTRDIEVDDISAVPLAISYSLEDPENFEQKKSSEAYNITIPATQNNSQTLNSPHNPSVEDLTADDFFTNHQPCVIQANGVEVLKGKAFLVEATHTDRPGKITINCYGNNADWLIDLKDTTLWDFVSRTQHLFAGADIQSSWLYDGSSEVNDYLYAPVRYRMPFLDDGDSKDVIATPFSMKPSLSIYWLLYRGFKSVGYKIQSAFMDSAFFRRLLMPWTWGDFLFADQTVMAPYLFRALCTLPEQQVGYSGDWHDWVSPPFAGVTQHINWDDDFTGGNDGGFEGQPGLYDFSSKQRMTYTYPLSAAATIGRITAGFTLQVYYYIFIGGGNHSLGLRAYWYRNLSPAVTNPDPLLAERSELLYQYEGNGKREDSISKLFEFDLDPGETMTCIMRIDASSSGTFSWNWQIGNRTPSSGNIPGSLAENYPGSYLHLSYLKKAIGSPVRFIDYPAFKNYKWADLLRGVIDAFNLSVQTDPVTKTVCMEPTHEYYTGNNPIVKQPGYLGKGVLDWRQKQELSKESTMSLYSDNERQFGFVFKEDGNDGGLNILNKRYSIVAGASRYLFPDRFQAGKKDYPNRFFSPVVHVRFQPWKEVTGVMPQIIALIPENLSNASNSEDAGKFEPKMAYYKGDIGGVGGWVWQPDPSDPGTRVNRTTLPFMFAVNYQTGGESDPVLTYSDQRIGDVGSNTGVLAHGLMRKFFLQRLAIMRNGRLYLTWMKLDMNDITNWLHRESIMIGGKYYYLIKIDKFQPLKDETTAVTLWQWAPITQDDDAACFPSRDSVLGTPNVTLVSSDLKYSQLLILQTDLPSA